MPFIETADRTSLFVTEWGSGPPVVFTHAWGLRSDEFDYQVPALTAAGLRCVLYDRRGHGRSDRPATGYDLDTMADDLAAVTGHFDLHEATLVAHSLGSKEAIRYLTRHGDSRIARLVLIAPTTPLLRRTADNPGGLDPALIAANYAAVAADVPKWCADFEAAGPYFGSSPGASQRLVGWTIRMIVDTPLPVLLETLKVNADADMRDELQKIQVPTLIIHGDRDASAPIDLTGRKTAELIPGASLTVYPGAGHGLYASDHDALNLRDSALSAVYGWRIHCVLLTWGFAACSATAAGSGEHLAGAGRRRAAPTAGQRLNGGFWLVHAHERRRAPWFWLITGYHT